MSSNPIYILQKDLPDAKAGDEYELRGDTYRPLTAEQSSSPVIETNSYFKWQVENNPEWFKKKEEPKERVEVSTFHKVARVPEHEDYLYAFYTNKKFDKELFPAIKQAIEAVLNPNKDTQVSKVPEAKVLSNIDAYQMGLKDGLNLAAKNNSQCK
jgi:hypothetical protein